MKIIRGILCVFISFLIIYYPIKSQAFSFEKVGIITEGDNFIKRGQGNIDPMKINSTLIDIGKILFSIAMGVELIVGMIFGVKYMTSGTNPKANMKEKFIWYIISLAVILGSATITTIVVNIIKID